jgi:hypothetical protein
VVANRIIDELAQLRESRIVAMKKSRAKVSNQRFSDGLQ